MRLLLNYLPVHHHQEEAAAAAVKNHLVPHHHQIHKNRAAQPLAKQKQQVVAV